MIVKTIVFLSIFTLPIQAANTDDEIVKNLDFFQNLELIKDDNPFLAPSKKSELSGQASNDQNQDKKEDKNEYELFISDHFGVFTKFRFE